MYPYTYGCSQLDASCTTCVAICLVVLCSQCHAVACGMCSSCESSPVQPRGCSAFQRHCFHSCKDCVCTSSTAVPSSACPVLGPGSLYKLPSKLPGPCRHTQGARQQCAQHADLNECIVARLLPATIYIVCRLNVRSGNKYSIGTTQAGQSFQVQCSIMSTHMA